MHAYINTYMHIYIYICIYIYIYIYICIHVYLRRISRYIYASSLYMYLYFYMHIYTYIDILEVYISWNPPYIVYIHSCISHISTGMMTWVDFHYIIIDNWKYNFREALKIGTTQFVSFSYTYFLNTKNWILYNTHYFRTSSFFFHLILLMTVWNCSFQSMWLEEYASTVLRMGDAISKADVHVLYANDALNEVVCWH
jgi:hypothetical protein